MCIINMCFIIGGYTLELSHVDTTERPTMVGRKGVLFIKRRLLDLETGCY